MRKAEYQRYLATPHWHAVRDRKLVAAGHRCEFAPIVFEHPRHGPIADRSKRCTTTTDLQVHHRHYGTLGAERDHDLEVLCRFHHLVRHASTSVECEYCGDPIETDDDDAIDKVEDAIRYHGGDIDKVMLCDIEPDETICWHCQDKFD